MTGLDKILEQIHADAERKAAAQVADAQKAADAVLEAARADAERDAAHIAQDAEQKAEDLVQRAASAVELNRRRVMLETKQSAIRDTVAAARDALSALPDDAYFEVLLKLVARYSTQGDGELQLSARDLARLPADFEAAANKAARGTVTVSKAPCDLKDGFQLLYGGIDVNCSFDALFEAEADALQDIAGGILFA
ncbi:MAG: V-type ATP synthase subunit E family protein [Clostridia bacterium]|nr:V-type ATP synthase subunit E family protein [Clostridia bacterium]